MKWIITNCSFPITLGCTVLAVFMILGAGCEKKPEGMEVRVGYIPFNNCLPFFTAIEKGYFSQQGLKVKPIRHNNSSEALNALIAGRVDALAGITFSSYWAAEQEEPGRFKLFLRHYEKPDDPFSYLLVSKNSDIRSPLELRGKRVGTYTGVSQILYLRLFLKKIGLEPDKDVTIVQVGSDLQIQALVAGQYDALFTVEPYGTIAVLKGIAKVLIPSPRTQYIQDPFWGGAAAVTAKYLEKNKRIVSLLYGGMADGVRFIREDVGTAKSFLPKYTPMEPEVATKSGLYKWVLLDEEFPTEGLQDLVDVMVKERVLRKKVDAVSMLLTPEDLR